MGDGAREGTSSRGGPVAIGNLKGGVGKSTIAVGIAGAWVGELAPGSRAHLEVLALETALA